jgi:transcriptional antiterminator NusG
MMNEDDKTRQGMGEDPKESLMELAASEEPAGSSEPAASETVGDEPRAEAAAQPGQRPPSSEGSNGPFDEGEQSSPEMTEAEPMERADVEAVVPEPKPEAETVAESVMPAVTEPISSDVTEIIEVEVTPEEADELAPEARSAPEAEVAGALVQPEAEAVEAPPVAEMEPAQVEAAEADDDRHWYVVHCYSGYENKVRHNLEQRIESMGMKDKIFDVVVPTEEEIEVKEGKRRTVERRVFPGYILVQMIMMEESWYVVRNTPGVTGFVGMGNEPTPLRPEEVAQIIRRMEAEAPRVKVTYKIDQKVRIIDGPFNDFIGTVDDIDMERAKVRVMVSFFGRETPVELDFLQVEKA